MIVKELMTSNVCFVTADASAKDAAALMKRYNIGLIPVCDSKGCLLGVISDRDILIRAVLPDSAETNSLNTLKAAEIMSENAVTISPEKNIHDAACIFSKSRLRRLPVTENARLIGILSISDLAKKRIFLAEVGEILGAIAVK